MLGDRGPRPWRLLTALAPWPVGCSDGGDECSPDTGGSPTRRALLCPGGIVDRGASCKKVANTVRSSDDERCSSICTYDGKPQFSARYQL